MDGDNPGEHVARKDRKKDTATEKDYEKWMARFQLRLALRPGVDRAVVLQAVKDVAGHCAVTGEHPQTAFGDPDAYAVQAAARWVPAGRAEREKRHRAVADAVDSVLTEGMDITGL
ncbi:hypothetical protein GA0115233_1006133 [Streptomyces sp. DI166]|nr:hypothetical protein GA0115233_1006133 [Streptomyces sp. DI166]